MKNFKFNFNFNFNVKLSQNCVCFKYRTWQEIGVFLNGDKSVASFCHQGPFSSIFLRVSFSKLFCTQLIATCKWQPAQLSVISKEHNHHNFHTKKHGEICFQKLAVFCLLCNKAAHKHVDETDTRWQHQSQMCFATFI